MSEIYLNNLDGVDYTNEVFNERVKIRSSHNLNFIDCSFNAGLIVYIDDDCSSLTFKKSLLNKFQVGYFKDKGILDGLNIDTCKSSQYQIFYADGVENTFDRRTKNLVWRNNECYDSPGAAYQPTIADNPILEGNISVGAVGERCNAFQTNNCLSPVIRGNTVGNTVSTTTGDGCGIIVDLWQGTDDFVTQEALVEDNLCFSNRIGISNWKGRKTVIRSNRCVDNEIGLKFNQYNDYHAYKNSLLNNETDVKFTNGATDAGYA